jgi:DNA primase
MRCYQRQLGLSQRAPAYLAGRGIDAEAARRLGLGYSSGHALRPWLKDAGFDDRRIRDSGLVTERGERFQGMIVVPELRSSQVHWLAGRSIRPDAHPRFQALPGPKPVLGLSRLPAASPWIVVAEGLFDWLLLASWGLPAVAALGTQGMDRLASRLQGQARVFLAFDADPAGREAAKRLSERLGRHRTRIVTLPEGVADAAELGAHPEGRESLLKRFHAAARQQR